MQAEQEKLSRTYLRVSFFSAMLPHFQISLVFGEIIRLFQMKRHLAFINV